MSVKVMTAVFDSNLPPNEKFILLAYADHASDDGTRVYPAVDTIAKKTGYSKRTVQRITRQLEDAGFLIPDGKGKKGTNRWKIPLDMGGVNLSPLPVAAVKSDIDDQGGDIDDTKSAQMSPEPLINHQDEPSRTKREGTPNKKRPYNTPPAVELLRRINYRYPPKKLYNTIDRTIGSSFGSLLKWGRIVRKWIASGHNPTNYGGMMDVFRNGWNHHQRKDEKYVTPGVSLLMKRAQQRAEIEREGVK